MLNEAVTNYSADVTRLTLASAGDTLDDANIEIKSAEGLILRLSALEAWYQDLQNLLEGARTEANDEEAKFLDDLFEAQIKLTIQKCEHAYDKMIFRDVIKEAFFTL